MKIIMVLMALALLLAGSSSDIMFIPVGSSNGTIGSVCPPDTVCYDLSQQIGQYFTYNVSTSLDEPYTFDARG